MKQREIFTSFAPVHLSFFCFGLAWFFFFQRTLIGLGFAIIQINIGTGSPQPGWRLVVDAAQTSSVCQAVSQSSHSLKTQAVTGGWQTRREVKQLLQQKALVQLISCATESPLVTAMKKYFEKDIKLSISFCLSFLIIYTNLLSAILYCKIVNFFAVTRQYDLPAK